MELSLEITWRGIGKRGLKSRKVTLKSDQKMCLVTKKYESCVEVNTVTDIQGWIVLIPWKHSKLWTIMNLLNVTTQKVLPFLPQTLGLTSLHTFVTLSNLVLQQQTLQT